MLPTHQKYKHYFDGWRLTGFFASILLALPLIALVWLALTPQDSIWEHLSTTILPHQLRTTLVLLLLVSLLAGSMGTLTAWLVTFCQFPGRSLLAGLLLLPLAIPTYIAAYSLGDFLDPAGPVYPLWQAVLPQLAFPRLQSIGGASLVLSLVLYPYVYLSARVAFIQQATHLIEAARTLGLRPVQCFWRVGLPMARPAIAVGLALVMMECLNDIGAVEYLGVETLTIGIYDTWMVRSNLAGAVQLALILLAFIAVLIMLERSQRGARGYHHSRGGRHRSLPRFALSPARQMVALVLCTLPVLLGFVLPVFLLVHYALSDIAPAGLARAASHSLFLALTAAALTCLIGLLLSYGTRSDKSRLMRTLTQIASLGYAIPGTVLAIGVMASLSFIDRASLGFIALSGTTTALMFAYIVRFLSLSYGSVEAGFGRVPPAMDMAARSLGKTRLVTLLRVHIPLLRPTLLAAMLLVFVDVMKELPATLILRPFDFETLASLVYTYASLGQIEEAALPALIIIGVGLIPVAISLALLDRAHRDSRRTC